MNTNVVSDFLSIFEYDTLIKLIFNLFEISSEREIEFFKLFVEKVIMKLLFSFVIFISESSPELIFSK